MNTSASLQHWQRCWEGLGIAIAQIPTGLYEKLIARYSEPQRHYHTVQHLDECLAHFAEVRHLADNPAEVELALWFHDAIYEPTRNDNEQLSADWAAASAKAADISDEICARIVALIMATCHQHAPINNDEAVLVDCDLAILGASAERFAEYEQQIRAEYAFAPDNIFRTKRAEILQQFLDRPTLFNTEHFCNRYEEQARSNLTQAINQLQN